MGCLVITGGYSTGNHPDHRIWRARQESNLDLELRRLLFYPLNYGRVKHNIVACFYPWSCRLHGGYNWQLEAVCPFWAAWRSAPAYQCLTRARWFRIAQDSIMQNKVEP